MKPSLILPWKLERVRPPPGGQAAYDHLSEDYKKGVDLALEQIKLHASIWHHFLFFKSLSKSKTESGYSVNYIRHNFYLKATKCAKDTSDPSPKSCPFRNDRPLIDCTVCYKMYSGAVESEPKPYVNCVLKPALTKEMTDKRKEHCDKMTYSSGTMTLLGITGEN
ncbi:hypothetical protein GJAV_G00092450 [Gymnothorax javanicus]|nr:hypothetical protein GJAV_G00092450 [Gymnothorax javanicus]